MDVETEEQISADGASEEDIEFTNSFGSLNGVSMVQTQSRKKTKVGNAMQMVGSDLLGRLNVRMHGCRRWIARGLLRWTMIL